MILIIKKKSCIGNHLGNVLTVISDRNFGVSSGGSLTLPNGATIPAVDYYDPDMLAANDYYPFGMLSRTIGTPDKYRFGFNGKETDNEVKGRQNQIDYGARVHDPRIGRFLSVDPLTKDYPWYTPYQFAGNKPIRFIDLDGLEEAEGVFTRIGREGIQGVFRLTWDDVEATTDAFNRNLNLFGIAAHGVYGTAMGKDLITQKPVNRVDAFTNMGVNGIMWFSGEKLFTAGMTPAANLEKQMAAQTFKKPVAPTQKAVSTSDPMIDEMSRPIFGALPSLSKGDLSNNILKVEASLAGQLEKHLINPQNGQKLSFSIENNSIKFASPNNKLGELYDFVIMSNGELRIGRGHWTLSEQANKVTAAGEIWINNVGKIEVVSNNSGHYQPTKAELINAARILKNNGLTTNEVQAVNVAPQ